jgi:pimeloyl-ACP methyl ester carboxylesterase
MDELSCQHSVLYPGRASRFRTPLIDNMAQMVAALQEELTDFQDQPFAFFGHSLGALIAFELTRSLRKAGMAAPELRFFSACDAAHIQPVPPLFTIYPMMNLFKRSEILVAHQRRYSIMPRCWRCCCRCCGPT